MPRRLARSRRLKRVRTKGRRKNRGTTSMSDKRKSKRVFRPKAFNLWGMDFNQGY